MSLTSLPPTPLSPLPGYKLDPIAGLFMGSNNVQLFDDQYGGNLLINVGLTLQVKKWGLVCRVVLPPIWCVSSQCV